MLIFLLHKPFLYMVDNLRINHDKTEPEAHTQWPHSSNLSKQACILNNEYKKSYSLYFRAVSMWTSK